MRPQIEVKLLVELLGNDDTYIPNFWSNFLSSKFFSFLSTCRKHNTEMKDTHYGKTVTCEYLIWEKYLKQGQ